MEDEPRVRKPGREAKLKARKASMPVNGRSVFVLQAVLGKRARDARLRKDASKGIVRSPA